MLNSIAGGHWGGLPEALWCMGFMGVGLAEGVVGAYTSSGGEAGLRSPGQVIHRPRGAAPFGSTIPTNADVRYCDSGR